MRLDHIVISVADLAAASADYRALGFTVTAGGRHSAGTTENALIAFKDGSYIELIAPTGDDPTGDGMDFRVLLRDGGGFSGFALHTDDFAGDITAMKGRGVDITTQQDGSRTKTSGETLRWQMALIGSTMTPFIIHDVTPRTLRVSDDPALTTHANGVIGAAALTVTARDVDAARAYYSAILGAPSGAETWALDGVTLTLAAVDADGLHAVTLRTTSAALAANPPDGNTHGAALRFTHPH